MKPPFVLAIDQGTTSSRAILFDAGYSIIASAQREFPQYFPHSGWVEHDPEDLWQTVIETTREAMDKANAAPSDIASIGITNQRETSILWERDTGKPVSRAIVWQDRRGAPFCTKLRDEGCEPEVSSISGLLLDPYFSASKIIWLLSQDSSLRRRAENGELAFGTVDSFLLWRLTGGKVHVTDATNAARTMLFDIRRGEWSDALLKIFNIPSAILPEVKDCAADFGETAIFGGNIKICGIAGDQQAAAVGQACFKPGMLKSTYGTGCFALLNTGDDAPQSQNRLLTTIAYQLQGKRIYALEGSIFIAGAAVQWLRDELQILNNAADSGDMAAAADETRQLIMVPAFTGLGAPYWNSEARGAIFGLTRAAGKNEFVRAALESACYQTRDLAEAMQADWSSDSDNTAPVLRVDGGMSASDWTMQFLSDILNAPVDRPQILETTALGAAYLAGLHSGIYPPPEQFAESWRLEKRFSPQMPSAERETKYAAWQDAVRRTIPDTGNAAALPSAT